MRSSRRLVIASSLTEQHNEWLAAHPSRPEVIVLATPWDVPENAEALFTYQTQWRAAPAARPAGWFGGLKWIQVASAGVDTFPPWFFEGPPVTRGLGVQAPAIAEYVLSAIFAHEKRFWDIRVHSRGDWRHRDLGGIAGKALGIAGFGAIGAEIATRVLPLGMRIKALTRSRPIEVAGVEQAASFDELVATSDHLVLALPLTPQTRCMVDRDRLAAARRGLHLINVARGAIIDDAALLEALDTGRVGAATLDVTSPEPLPDGHPFYGHPRIRLTPHVSGQSEDLEQRLSARLLDNLEKYLFGRPLQGIVDVEHRY